MKRNEKVLKDALIKLNVLSEDEALTHHAAAKAEGVSFKHYLLSKQVVNERQILISLTQFLDLEQVDLASTPIDKTVMERVPIKFAWYYKLMPISRDDSGLRVAMAEPVDVKTQDEIRLNLGEPVRIVLCTEKDLLEAIRKYYGFASETIDRMLKNDTLPMRKAGNENEIEDLEKVSEDPTVSNLVNQIILEAARKRATDIHIEPYRDKVRFRYRIDGVLIDANLPDNVKHFLPAICSRIKILANLSITEKRLPQDGSTVVRTKEQQLDLRVSTIPTPRGESMVIRILPSKVTLLSLERLGFNPESVEKFRFLIRKPHGVIFLTGPTGSGKTTSLYACLNEINSAERKIITIEDPVEYEMDGITQVQVNPKVNFHFSTGLRSLLRHDPDIIMVGEVRDLETAEIAIRTALTGHLVFSSLHTNDSASGITRLIDMGVEPYLVASSVEAFVAQRLVRLICPKCRMEDPEPMKGVKEEIARSLGVKTVEDMKIFRGMGCDHCNNTGYYGRMAIYEILIFDDELRKAVLDKPRSDYIKTMARQKGLVTLRQNGWRAVLDGLTTPDEVVNVTVKDEPLDSEKTVAIQKPSVSAETSISAEERSPKVKDTVDWQKKNQYDSRIYSRAFQPLEIRYRLARRDPGTPEALISDGIEYAALSEDVSAGGLRFVSKIFFSIGSTLDIKIFIPEGGKTVSCLAKVCRVEEDSLSGVYTIVTYYLDISSSDRSFLNTWIDARTRPQSISQPVANSL